MTEKTAKDILKIIDREEFFLYEGIFYICPTDKERIVKKLKDFKNYPVESFDLLGAFEVGVPFIQKKLEQMNLNPFVIEGRLRWIKESNGTKYFLIAHLTNTEFMLKIPINLLSM